MKIRKLTASDRQHVIELWRKVFPNDPLHNEPSKVIADKLAVDDLIFVAEDNHEIIGACMVGYDGHRGWLYALAVAPGHRRKGVGTKLVNTSIESLKELGCSKVNLQIRSDNSHVESFYKSLGFKTEDRISMGVLFE